MVAEFNKTLANLDNVDVTVLLNLVEKRKNKVGIDE